MSKKNNYGHWRGRPNPPPLNWDTPDKPAIRKVDGSFDDLPDQFRQNGDKQDAGETIAVILAKGHWTYILKALHRYGEEHGDGDWKEWRDPTRREILGKINPTLDNEQSVAVNLSIEDWRKIWWYVKVVCEGFGDDWVKWFKGVSDTMTEQIKGN